MLRQRGVFIPNKFGLAEGRRNAALLLSGSRAHLLMPQFAGVSGNRRLPALVQFALRSTTRFDGRWPPSHENPFRARPFGLPQNRQRRRARPPTVWPARNGISGCSIIGRIAVCIDTSWRQERFVVGRVGHGWNVHAKMSPFTSSPRSRYSRCCLI